MKMRGEPGLPPLVPAKPGPPAPPAFRRQQEVFALRHVEGFSTAEVAETLDLSTGSAKRHLFRAVQRLRDALQGTP